MIDIPLDKRLVLALDTPDKESALDLVRRTRDVVGTYKVGLGLFTTAGPQVVERLRRDGAEVFLDLKMHDIPSTVEAGVRAAAKHGVSLLTVHALGGPQMLQAAMRALSEQTAIPGQAVTRVLGVSVLTHHTGNELRAMGTIRRSSSCASCASATTAASTAACARPRRRSSCATRRATTS